MSEFPSGRNTGAPSASQGPRRRFLKALGLGAGAAGLAATVPSRGVLAAGPAVTDVDILNFALNLEYLEAEYYSLGVFGKSIEAMGIPTTGAGDPGPLIVKAEPTVPFATNEFRMYGEEVALDEQKHVVFLRHALKALGAEPVARPTVDLLNSFAGLGSLVGVPDFDPFADEVSFLIGAYIFEDVGVSAYHGAAGLIQNKDILVAAAGILGVEAYHAGLVRTVLFNLMQGPITEKISEVRKSLGDQVDYGVAQGPLGAGPVGHSSIVLADHNALAGKRNTREVLNIVYGARGAHSGLFFPDGLNGLIR